MNPTKNLFKLDNKSLQVALVDGLAGYYAEKITNTVHYCSVHEFSLDEFYETLSSPMKI